MCAPRRPGRLQAMTDAPVLRSRSIALLGGLRQQGAFATGPSTTHVSLIGGVNLDLSAAQLPPEGLTITKVSLIGGVSLIVPAGVRVESSGFALFGGRDIEADSAAPATGPVVRVRHFGLAGGVKVRRA
jgi:hypothetical protein